MERSPEYGVLVGRVCCGEAGACARTTPVPTINPNATKPTPTREIIIL